ncbi:aldehyde dehydrogenase (NADP(+)) [Acidipila sp. EB88]|nr:aldehyde dehydrogenase (NADP(+)) [Acidipila sp. EB88]
MEQWVTATLIDGQGHPGTGAEYRAVNPATGASLEPLFADSGAEQVAEACEHAEQAFDTFRQAPLEQRASLLDLIAEEIVALGDALLDRAGAESGLPRGRLEGERGRTVGQLRMFAEVVRSGAFEDRSVDVALPDRKPAPRPELRLRRLPVGPVAVFGASNFPLAFSVAGGDTASALAAGCPVVAKAHPSHPGTSQLVGLAVQRAVAKSGLPAAIFALVHGSDHSVGEALVQHPAIAAVGFTGSRIGGLALCALAAKRAVPIPVFAEMSSINPVFALPTALEQRGEQIAADFVDSLVLGCGQFCTQPGLLFALDSPELRSFEAAAAARLAAKPAAAMLNPGMHAAYQRGIAARRVIGSLELLAEGSEPHEIRFGSHAALFAIGASDFLSTPQLSEELFGPCSIIVRCGDEAELLAAARAMEGQLTATLQIDPADYPLAAQLLPILERKAGRVLANGFPTGVEVAASMVHGGPYPATSDSRFTSVGTLAIERFLRPVCYQNLPAELLR